MIVVDILHNVFEILPELILGAGPFCVFKGMGTGKDSGKLLFKKIYTDGGLSITEDENSLDLSATGISDTAVCLRKIAFGCSTGNGLTSSVFASLEGNLPQCDSVQCISIIGGSNNCNYVGISGTNQDNRTSLVVGGSQNKIKQGPGHVIIGGYQNYIKSQCQNSIVSSESALIDNSICSSVLSSHSGKIYDSCSSSILSSYGSKIYNSRNSSIFGYTSKIKNSQFTSTLGCLNEALGTKLTFISGYRNCGSTSSITSILNGKQNIICKFCTFESSIVNGYSNFIVGASQSVILNGTSNRLSNQNMTNKTYVSFQSSILNGTDNAIIVDDDDPGIDKYVPGGRNVIANGILNCINKSSGNSIIMNGYRNEVLMSNSTILNGFKNKGSCTTIIHSSQTCGNSNDVIFSQDCVIACGLNKSTIIVPALTYFRNSAGRGVCEISDQSSKNLRNSVIVGNHNGIIFGGAKLPVQCFDNSFYTVNLNTTPPIPPFLIGPPWGVTVSNFATSSITNIVFGNTIFTPMPRGQKGIKSNIIGSFTASEHELNRRILSATNLPWKSSYGVPQILASQPPQIAAYSSSFTTKFGFTISSYYSYFSDMGTRVTTVEGYCFVGSAKGDEVQHLFTRNSIISQGSCIGRVTNKDFYNKTVSGCYSKLSYNNILKGIKVSNSVIIGGSLHKLEPKVEQSAILGGTGHCLLRTSNSVIIAGESNKLDGWYEADQLNSSSFLNFYNTVILGGCTNCGRVKPALDGFKGNRNSVIIGGLKQQFSGSNRVISQNLSLYCCLSYYNFATSTKSDGVSATKTGTITSITVCNGIITNLS
jgi:hypothetical protein